MSYGSALGQDEWILQEVYPGKTGGYFVEAGALNGVDESNTVRLERERGWQGLLVEPATPYFRELEKNRRAALENVCLLDRETDVDFLEAGGHGGIPEFFSANYQQTGRATQKKALPLATLLDKHHAPARIDYLSLDTEGTELTILQAFPFDRYSFGAITVEHNHHAPQRDGLRALLQSKGYVLCREVLVDDWWLHESVYEQIPTERKDLWKL
jgi:FkbM family methyltransferase